MSLSTKKRFVEEEARRVKRGSGFSSHTEIKNEDNLVFEDPFGDDLEDEEMIESDEDMEGVDDRKQLHDELDQEQHEVKRVFLPGVDSLDEDEVLDYDASAYDMYYAMTAEWPSLSFDIMKDTLGDCRTRVSTWYH
jgi:ribosome assembly protein RRB1